LQYLEKLEVHDNEAEKVIVDNYETEFQKVESVSQMLITMITDYKEKLQKRLTDSMVKERNQVNLHLKDIQQKK
jgi:hypothetical protein